MRFKINKTAVLFWLALAVIIFLIYSRDLPFTHLEGSRLATVESLVSGNGFAIDNSLFIDTVDKVWLEGRFISTKPPVLSVLAAGLVKFLELFLPWDFRQAFILFGLHNVYYVAILFVFVVLPWLLSIYLADKLLKYYKVKHSYLALFVLAGVSLWTAYLGRFTNHIMAAALLFASLYFYLLRQKGGNKYLLWSGFFASSAVVFELSAVVWWLLLGWAWCKDYRLKVWLYLVGSLPAFLVHLALTFLSSGSFLPVYLRKELYDYPGSYWLSPQGIDAINQPTWLYFFNIIFGTHGLFFYSPIYLFAIAGMWRGWKNKHLRFVSILSAIGILSFILYYGFRTSNFGGVAYGMRWFIVLVPVLWLWFVYYLQNQEKVSALLIIALLWSGISVLVGIFHPLAGEVEIKPGSSIFFPWLAGALPFLRYLRLW